MKIQMRTGRNSFPSRPLSSTCYFNPIKKAPNRKKRFVKNPLFPHAFGQNKTLKPSQNNLVINTTNARNPLPLTSLNIEKQIYYLFQPAVGRNTEFTGRPVFWPIRWNDLLASQFFFFLSGPNQYVSK
jgi:hypothetical protein